MKFLHDRKAVKGLRALISRCASKEGAPTGHCAIRKIGKHKTRERCEMRLSMQIGDYEMDQVILDLGLNVNVFPKHTWERMGRPTL